MLIIGKTMGQASQAKRHPKNANKQMWNKN